VIDANKKTVGTRSANARDFRQAFIGRVHEVIEGGYRRLEPAAYVREEEPAITGVLRKAMNGYLRDLSAPDWADYFSVHDDPPVEDGIRKGKRRNRIDIRVDSSRPRPGASFSIEAKRLARGYTAGKYVSGEGLGSFLCGEYARDEDEAGMLGYMQDNDATHWSGEIVAVIEKNPAAHEVSGNGWWKPHAFARGPQNVFVSVHTRAAVGRPITIYHTLLLFSDDVTKSGGEYRAVSEAVCFGNLQISKSV